MQMEEIIESEINVISNSPSQGMVNLEQNTGDEENPINTEENNPNLISQSNLEKENANNDREDNPPKRSGRKGRGSSLSRSPRGRRGSSRYMSPGYYSSERERSYSPCYCRHRSRSRSYSPYYGRHRSRSYSPYYGRHRSRSYSPYYGRHRSRSYSPYYRRHRSRSYSPYYRRHRSRSRYYSPYYRRYRSRSRFYSPYYYRIRHRSRSYSPYHHRRQRSRSYSPRYRSSYRSRRHNHRSYSCGSRSYTRSTSPDHRRSSRRRYSRSVSSERSRRSYSRSVSPVPRCGSPAYCPSKPTYSPAYCPPAYCPTKPTDSPAYWPSKPTDSPAYYPPAYCPTKPTDIPAYCPPAYCPTKPTDSPSYCPSKPTYSPSHNFYQRTPSGERKRSPPSARRNRWHSRESYSRSCSGGSRDDPEAIELTSSDVQCLNPGTYLTSPIMNFYIRYLQKLVSPTGRNNDCHFFNTCFYKKLLDDVSFKGNKDEQFLKLRRWCKGVNIFHKAYIFLPIHGDMHWSLVIICMPNKEDELGPVILHLDSLGIHSSDKILKDVECFLIKEWRYLKNNEPPVDLPFYDRIWKNLPSEIMKDYLTVPQQKNGYDCGLFVLYFMKKFIKEAPMRFQKRYILSTFGRTKGRNWFEPRKASGLREKIRHLLAECDNVESDNVESDNDEALKLPSHSSSSSK